MQNPLCQLEVCTLLSLEWFHLIVGVVDVLFGVLGGLYALRALFVLYVNPETRRAQLAIWLPILIGCAFFTVKGVLHFAVHSLYASFFSSSEINLLREIFSIIGLSFLTIGVMRYSRSQIGYHKLKQEALRKIESP